MQFDVIEITDDDLAAMTAQQYLILVNAQLKKDELTKQLAEDKKSVLLVLLANGMARSSTYSDLCAELDAAYAADIEVLVEKLQYNLANTSLPVSLMDVGYDLNFALSEEARMEEVQAYYLAIEDPSERMRRYAEDETAKEYLGDYYDVLYGILSQYSA